MSLPGIGAKVADKILELRDAKGDLELDDLNQVPYLRLTPIPGNDISSSMEQMLIKIRIIINKNKKHVAFYFVVYVCMQQFL
jgi:hypothetical protein